MRISKQTPYKRSTNIHFLTNEYTNAGQISNHVLVERLQTAKDRAGRRTLSSQVECRHLLSITAAYRRSGKDRYSGSTCSNQRLQLCFWYFCCAFLIFRFWILCKINYNNVKYLFLQSTYCPTSVNIQWRCSFSLKAKRMKPSWQVRKLGLLIPIRIRLHNYSEDLTRWK